MDETKRFFGALTLAVLLSLFLGSPALRATENVKPTLGQGCDLPAETPRSALNIENPSVEGPVSKVTPATSHDETVLVCLFGDFLCGGCPVGTLCASEATVTSSGLCCTGGFRCVASCVAGGCDGLCARLPD